jgi:acetyltransferase-like isoleucine patch superfamily enzyme
MILLTSARVRFLLRACTQVGRDCRLDDSPTVQNYGGEIRVGDRLNLVSRPVRSHLVAGPKAVLEIGDDVAIGHGAAIAAFQQVRIGSRSSIGPFVIIMDTNFHGEPGNQSVRHDCRPVSIGADCRIGSRVTITRGASIGDGAEILAGSVVTSAIPAGVCAAGARARVVGRPNRMESRWDSAAALLPELAMAAFDLQTRPDLADVLRSLSNWDNEGLQRLTSSVRHRLGVTLTDDAVHGVSTLAEMAVIIEAARKDEK